MPIAGLLIGQAVTARVGDIGLCLSGGLGLELGDRVGRRVGPGSEQIGAAVLVLVGVAVAAGLI